MGLADISWSYPPRYSEYISLLTTLNVKDKSQAAEHTNKELHILTVFLSEILLEWRIVPHLPSMGLAAVGIGSVVVLCGVLLVMTSQTGPGN